MLPHIGAPQHIFHTLICHLRDDVVGQLDGAFDIMDLALFAKQGHLHYFRCHLIPIHLSRLGILELSDLAVIGIVEAACQVVVMGTGSAYDCWVYPASNFQLSFVAEGVSAGL